MTISHNRHSSALHDPQLLLHTASVVADAIKTKTPNAKCVVVCGMSGAVIGAVVSTLTDLPMVIVRKQKEDTHSWYREQGNSSAIGNGNYVIIDDLIDSGKTVDWIVERTSRANHHDLIIVDEVTGKCWRLVLPA